MNNRLRKGTVLIFICVAPAVAFAHTKWFATEPLLAPVTSEPTALYLTLWALVAAIIVALGLSLERTGRFQLEFLAPKTPYALQQAAMRFSVLAGSFLVLAATHEYVFSPNYKVEAGVPVLFHGLELLVGLAFIVSFHARLAALILILLWIATWFLKGALLGPVAAIEDIWVVSTAVFILIVGSGDYFRSISSGTYIEPGVDAFFRKYEDYALPILRLGTGATLFILGFSEKILHPEYGINFLDQHHWNFMRALGLPYSDYLFTLSAGAVESLFGLLFMLGVVTRLNALVVAVFFTIPLFILGPIELAGHLPHFAAVVLLLLFGSGDRLKIVSRSAVRVFPAQGARPVTGIL